MNTSSTIPTASELQNLAIETARRLRCRRRRRRRRRGRRLPDQRRTPQLPGVDRRRWRRRRRRPRPQRLPRMAQRPRTRPRGAGQAPRRAPRRTQGRPRHAHQPRGRQDHLGSARRSPGDDRHLRLRGRSLPAAVRPHHAVRAPRSPAHGDLAPARRRGSHQRLQLPGRRLVLEHRHRLGVRGSGGVEAVRADTAHVAGMPRHPRPSHRRDRRSVRPVAGPDRRRRSRTGPGGTLGRRPAQRDRLDPDGPRRGPPSRRPVRSRAARARRQQRRDRQPQRGPRPDHPRNRVLGRRNRRAAVHHHAPRDRPQQRDRRAHRATRLGVRPAADRQPHGRRHLWSAR